MTLKGEVLCTFSVLLPVLVTYGIPACPEICFCNFDFTDCKHNGLVALPETIDPNVTSLDISHNEFKIFPLGLNKFRNLIHLNLSYNKISVLEYSALYGLTNLERLDLTYNLFSDWMDIRSQVFSPTRKLTFLDFSHNPLRSLASEKNPLRIDSLQVLRLNNCSMRNIHTNIFARLPNIMEFHMSQNPITVLNVTFVSRTLKFLDLSRCNLKHIGQHTFSNLTALETIWLFQNINLKKFSSDSESLLYLDLSDCNLEAVPNGYLPKVYYANFHGNHFRIIQNNSFYHFTKLKFLDLSYNAISLIDEEAFTGLNYLENIDLSINTLTTLNDELFISNSELKYLNLSRNYFSKVENLIVPSLQVLDLSSCEIQTVGKGSLEDMPNLRILNLSKNVISLLPDYFQGVNLISLDASLCRIKNINNKTLAAMTSLRELNLAGNRLTTVYPECFIQVINLDISDNPWRCDCLNLKETYYWLTKTGKRIDTLVCQSPEALEGLTWLEACQNEWHPELNRKDTVWWYTIGLIIAIFAILFLILAMRRMYLLKEKRIRQADEARRAEERETLRRMRRMQLEAQEEDSRNAPDPRELQTPPSYNDALLLPRLDASHPSLSGSLHSIASKQNLYGSNPDVAKRGRPRRKRRRRKSDSSEGQRASRVVVDTDTSDREQPQPRTTLESDF